MKDVKYFLNVLYGSAGLVIDCTEVTKEDGTEVTLEDLAVLVREEVEKIAKLLGLALEDEK